MVGIPVDVGGVLMERTITDFEVRYYWSLGGRNEEAQVRRVFRVVVFREGVVVLAEERDVLKERVKEEEVAGIGRGELRGY